MEILRHQEYLHRGTTPLGSERTPTPASFDDKNKALQQKILTFMVDLVKPSSKRSLVDLKSDMEASATSLHQPENPVVSKINRLGQMLTDMSPTSNFYSLLPTKQNLDKRNAFCVPEYLNLFTEVIAESVETKNTKCNSLHFSK